MKQTFASIAIIGLFVVMSISDFDIGIFPDAPVDWHASQDPQCPDFELPEYAVTGTDMACIHASRLIKAELDRTAFLPPTCVWPDYLVPVSSRYL